MDLGSRRSAPLPGPQDALAPELRPFLHPGVRQHTPVTRATACPTPALHSTVRIIKFHLSLSSTLLTF